MLLTLYPNSELRVRVPPPPLVKRRRSGSGTWSLPSDSFLTIAAKLRQVVPEDFFSAERKREGPRPGYGGLPRPVQFGPRARRKIVRCGALLGRLGRSSRVLFLTGTLPGSTTEAVSALARQSAWVVHQLLRTIPRAGRFRSSDARWIWVWEYQKRGALHWHCVLECPDYLSSLRVRRAFHGLWCSALRGVARRECTDIAARADGGTWRCDDAVWQARAEVARKRPDRYLAKYLSKGTTCLDAKGFPPTRWYGVSRSLHRLLPEHIRYVDTASRRSEPGHQLTEADISILTRLFSVASRVVSFMDKVRSGHTFVIYWDGVMAEKQIKRVLGRLTVVQPVNSDKTKASPQLWCYALEYFEDRAFLYERLYGGLSEYYQDLLGRYYRGESVPSTEVFFLEQAARRELELACGKYRGNPRQSDSVGLPGQSASKIEPGDAPNDGNDQASLFP